MEYPLVSIITPLFNCEKYIRETIKSVISQTYSNWEMIIVDDNSQDGSKEIVQNIKRNEKRIKLIYNKLNMGAGISRNKAIQIAKGTYIAFLDSDDVWHKDKLKIQIDLMEKNNWKFSHTSYGYLNDEGQKIKSTFHVSGYPISYKDLLKRTEISCLTAVYNQKLIGKYFMSEHKRKQDYALWLSILNSGISSYPIDKELAWYRQRTGSATNKKSKLVFNHITFLMETQSMSIFKSIYYTLFWMVNGFFRYIIK